MKTEVVGLGAGGHAKSVIDALMLGDAYVVVGLLDPRVQMHGAKVLGTPVLGGDEQLAELRKRGVRHAFIGVGGLDDTAARTRLKETLRREAFQIVAAIHPAAVVSPFADVGEGLTALAGAVINAGAKVGENVIVNTGAIVEHDCVVDDDAHIASGAGLAGGVKVGRGALVGAGACVRPLVVIGEAAIVGAGAVVVRDVPPGSVVVGCPARELRKRDRRCAK